MEKRPPAHFYGKNRPDSVTVSGTRIDIKWFQDLESVAEIDFGEMTISIGRNVSPSMAVDALIHEILHALWYFSAVPKKAREERAVSVLSSGLNSVFSSNQSLALWISEIHHDT